LKRSDIHSGGEGGQAVILLVVAMSVFLIGAVGLAIDGGQMYAQRQMAQTAADAAAQAGIMSIFRGTNLTAPSPFANSGTSPAPYVCTMTDGIAPCVFARDNGFGGTAADTVTLSYPQTVPGVNLSPATVPAVTVTVTRTLKMGLMQFLGAATSSITAKATAGLVGAVSHYCVYVLDPSGQDALLVNNGANVTLNGCGIAVASAASHGATISYVTLKATDVDIVGGCNCTGTYPVIHTGVLPQSVADPFASLPAPAPGPCVKTGMYSPPSNTTLVPGNYCGGITVSNGVTNVTFLSGIYTITGGGVTFSGGATATGNGVMFYLTGNTTYPYASATIGGGVSVSLWAQTSGVYQGVLFFGDRTIHSASNANFGGGASMKLSGSLYFRTTSVSFSNGTGVEANSTAIVAMQVLFSGGAQANIQHDATGAITGLFSRSVALVR